MAFAFSGFLYPHPHRLPLRVAFPCGEDTDLPSSVRKTLVNGLGSAYSPGCLRLRTDRPDSVSCTLTFWSSLSIPLACLVLTTFISGSLTLTMPFEPSSQPHGIRGLVRPSRVSLSGLHCLRDSTPSDYSNRILGTHTNLLFCQ